MFKLLLISFLFSLAMAAELGIKQNFVPENCARKTQAGDTLQMHYTGRLNDASGAKFDSSRDRGKTFDFVLGAGRVIKGWDQGLVGRCIGEKLELTIPPELGYGSRAMGSAIPANSVLWFDVEVVGIVGVKNEL